MTLFDQLPRRVLLVRAAAKKRDLAEDHQLLKAIDLLRHSATQADLFAAARASNSRRGD